MNTRPPLVLIVDDDLAVRESLKFALELEGLEVDVWPRGADLLASPRLPQADCLILEHRMPGMDGFALLAALQARGCRVPVILITDAATAPIRRRASQAGVRHIVEKPLLDSALIESLTDILGSRPAGRVRKTP
jgi:FixJ family two-component response regulator